MKAEYVVLVFAALACGAYGLQCYTCDGHDVVGQDNECGDTFEPKASLLKECNATAGEIFCRKQKKGVNKAWTNIERSCSAQCEDQNVLFIKRVTCCKKDGCNGGSSVAATVVVVLGAAALSSVAFWK